MVAGTAMAFKATEPHLLGNWLGGGCGTQKVVDIRILSQARPPGLSRFSLLHHYSRTRSCSMRVGGGLSKLLTLTRPSSSPRFRSGWEASASSSSLHFFFVGPSKGTVFCRGDATGCSATALAPMNSVEFHQPLVGSSVTPRFLSQGFSCLARR